MIWSKYRNDYGRKVRKQYDAHDRSVGRRKDMKSFQARPTPHSGTITTFPEDNIVCILYDKKQ